MATISASIALQDRMSPVMKPMLNGMNSMIAGFEKMERASGKAVDVSGLSAAKAELNRAGAAFKQVEQSIEDATREQEKFNNSARNGGAAANGLTDNLKGVAATLGTLFAIDKIIDFGTAAVQSAGAAKAITSQFEQTFGDLQMVAQKNINKMAGDFGMVPNRLKPAMSQMTSMFKGLGLDTESAMGKATMAVTLAADAAAFYDKSYNDANAALTSFLKGNYEGGEAIGVFANDTQMAIFAVTQGVVAETKEWAALDEATKQATRLTYAQNMQQLAGATGQAARESDGLENQMGNVQQAWTDFLAIAGSPVLESVVGVLKNITTGLQSSDANVSQITSDFNKFGDVAGDAVITLIKMSKQIMIAVAAFVAYKAVISPSIALGKSAVLSFKTITGAIAVMTTGATAATPAIASMAAALTFLTGPVGIAVMALAALSAGLVALYINKKNDTVMTKDQITANNKFISSIDSTIESINSGVAAREQSLRSSELEIVAAKTLADQIFNLSDKQNKSAYELSLLNGYVDQFNQVMPNANLLIDTQTGALNLSRDAVWEYIAAEQERIRIAAGAEMMIANKKAELEATMGLSSANAELVRLEAEKSAAAEAALAQGGTQVQMAQNVAKATEEYNTKIAAAKTKQDELTASMALVKTEGDKINQMMSDPSGFAAKEANEQAALAATTLYTGSSLEIMETYKQSAATKAAETGAAVAEGHKKGWLELPFASEQAGQQATAGFIAGALGNQAGIADAGKTSAQVLIDSTNSALQVNSPSKVFQTTGNYVGDGLIQGLKDRESQIAAGGDAAATALKNSFKSALGINSPSTVFRDFGFYAIDGLIQGLSSSELMTFCEGIVQEIKDAFANNKFTLQTGIDFLGSGAPEFFKEIGVGGANLGDLVAPVAGGITSGFGYRDPFMTDSGQMSSSYHEGIDIGAAYGTAVGAAGAGQVTFAGDAGGYGNMVRIDHGGGLETMYAHLSSILVSVGEFVTKMQTIGLVGSTGNSTGAHLHFGLYQDGAAIDPSGLFGGYASGTNFATRGLHLVGENGPEIMSFAGGEKVLDADKSKAILDGAGARKSGTDKSGNVVHFQPTITMSNVINSELDIKKIADKLGDEIEDRMMRTASGL